MCLDELKDVNIVISFIWIIDTEQIIITFVQMKNGYDFSKKFAENTVVIYYKRRVRVGGSAAVDRFVYSDGY